MGFIYCFLPLRFSLFRSLSPPWRKTFKLLTIPKTIQALQSSSLINPSMALKLSTFTTPSHKVPCFALPQMASRRSPKFSMASTLRSNSKSVFISVPFSFLLLFFFSLSSFHFSCFGSGFMFFPSVCLHLGWFLSCCLTL